MADPNQSTEKSSHDGTATTSIGRKQTEEIKRQTTTLLISIVTLFGIVFLLLVLDSWLFDPQDLVPDGNADIIRIRDQTELKYELYQQWKVNQNLRAFEWQDRSTKVLFWISMLITTVGIGFSFWQFTEASRSEKAAEQEDQLEIRSQFVSLAFKSRSLATFMMCVSIAYLLIYVTLVYPLRLVDDGVERRPAEPDPITPVTLFEPQTGEPSVAEEPTIQPPVIQEPNLEGGQVQE